MGIGDRPGGLKADPGDLARIAEFTPVQSPASDELHGIVTMFRTASGAEHLDDVRMVKHGDDARLVFKLAAPGGILQQQRRNGSGV